MFDTILKQIIMKRILLTVFAMASINCFSFAAKHTITNVGTTFSPNTLTIEVGENVEFSLAGEHNAVEVTKATWDANGNTRKSGGFSVPFGGGEVVFNTAGTYYYVCEPHASVGMKGRIIVVAATAVPSVPENVSAFEVFPNPASSFVTISYTLHKSTFVNIRLINTVGVEIADIIKESQAPGRYESIFYLNDDLIPGIYYININSDNQSYIEKVLLK